MPVSQPETPDAVGPSTPLGPSAPRSTVQVSATRIALVGTVLWVIALGLTLILPALHTGDRSWWPWTCVSGIGLGLFAYTYVRRGRGNASGA